MVKILIVEDELPISELLRISLRKAGYVCTCVFDGMAAADAVERDSYDLILLDVMLPGISGFELMDYIKEHGTPVIFITARNNVNDRVKGLKMGAEDYIIKPFEILELLARVEGVLRRHGKLATVLHVGGLDINTEAMQVTRGGVPITLTRKEYEIFCSSPKIPGSC